MRVLVADRQTVFRAAVRNLLEREHDVEVTEAGTLSEAVAAVAATEVDVVLVDLNLLPATALQAVRMLRSSSDTAVIAWSLEPKPESVLDMIRAGADGYLDKQITPENLVFWLRRGARGESVISRELTTLMVTALHTLDERERSRRNDDPLSVREREVLAQLALGARNRQIAEALAISEFTVKRHVQNILGKLGVPSRHDAAAFYRAVYAGDPARVEEPVSAGADRGAGEASQDHDGTAPTRTAPRWHRGQPALQGEMWR